MIKIKDEKGYREVECAIYDRLGTHLKTFWCWDYYFSRAMDEVWNDLKKRGKFPDEYKISRRRGRWDNEMRKYESPLTN